jgi:glycosyltransferase involved in cell wall biosynthesis
MKITIVQGAFLPVPPLIGGAVEKIWFGLGNEFAQLGHDVTHISITYNNLNAEEYVNGVHYIRVPGFKFTRSLLILKTLDLIYSYRVLKVLPKKADILITNTFWLPILVRNSKYGRLYVHVARYPKGQMRFYRHAARIQTVSSSVAEAIKLQDPKISSKVKVIPNFINTSRNLTSFLSEKKQKWFLYVGRIHPEKGISLLLNAFQELIYINFCNDWKLVIVGPWEVQYGGGGYNYYAQLKKQYFLIQKQVEWVGPIFEPEKLDNYYKQASLFVYPSLAEKGETFGLAPLEAMAQGCPPLVSNLECFKDFIEHGKNGFIFNHHLKDPKKTLVEELQKIISSTKLIEIGKNSLKTAQCYTLEKIANEYLNDFQYLIDLK